MRTGTPRPHPSGPPEVAVLGGGLIGLVTAWRAAQRGLRVTVVDPAPGGGAALVAAGMLAAVTELHYGEETLLRLNLASARRYPEFVRELEEASGREVGYRACGTLSVALDADDRAHLRELHALQARCGLDSRWLTGRECRRLEPLLAPSVRGGVRVDGDHQVDPRRLVAALLRAGAAAGVEFRHATARRLLTEDGRAAGVALDDGTELRAGQTVLAAGAHAARLAGVPAGLLPPVRPVKGQVLRLRMPTPRTPPPGRAPDGDTAPRPSGPADGAPEPPGPADGGPSGAALATVGAPYHPGADPAPAPTAPAGGFPSLAAPLLSRTVRAVVRGTPLYLVPRANGELVVGATSEETGFDTTVTAGGVYELLRDAHELVPGVTELPLAEVRAGLRPGSPDNAPLLGPTALPGLHLATGHFRNGVLLTPITGDAMAELLRTGEVPEPIRPFTPERFTPDPEERPS
ncbi:FAD-dependent oxidoreductase [Streptomyces sp. AJS327]|uniref:FAD-dependent oxidoreductase n=1 Tax=Streptomyces sp. AJS327 TaxID=2545265 RepID=UPI0027E3BF4A|nr:FAD-dependent oxidoreductase [Streptomyces sp. AJS327]